MGNILNGNPASIITQLQPVLLVDASGNSLNILTSGTSSAVGSINGLTGAVTVAGAGSVSVLTAGQTITVSGSAVGTPTSSTDKALTRWSGTGGNSIQNSPVVLSDAGIFTGSNMGVADSATYTITAANGQVQIVSSGQSLINAQAGPISLNANAAVSLNAGYIGASGNINFNSSAGVVSTAINVLPSASGTIAVGVPSTPFASGVFNNYLTTRVITSVTAASTTINWANGASQALNFSNGQPSGTSVLFSGMTVGSTYVLETNQNASGTASVTWPATTKWQLGVAGTLTPSGAALDLFSFYNNSGTSMLGNASYNYF